MPSLYYAYLSLVWRTSRIEHLGTDRMVEARRRHEKAICALWHENVFFVSYAFRELRGSTLASRSDLGDVITRMLERCRFVVFRGGSSKGKARQSRVLVDLIRHMESHRNVLYGITVDGSRGPARVLKPGVVAIARATGAPIFAVHVASSPCVRIPSWDRMRIPLPFGKVFILFEGPLFCPRDAGSREFQTVTKRVEDLVADTSSRADGFLATGRLGPLGVGIAPGYGGGTIRRGPNLLRAGEIVVPVPLV